MQIRSSVQDNLDQVSNWCDNNHLVINPIKTKSITIATRQKHHLSPLPLDLVLNGAKTDQVSEHRLLGITIDNKLRWDSHINNVCKTVSRRVFLLSKLRYIVDIDTRKLFFNAHIKPHIDYASVVWDGCSDVFKRRLNSLHRRAVKLILPDTTLTTDQILKEMRIMSLQKNDIFFLRKTTTKVCSCTRSSAMRPQSTYLTCIYTLPHAIPVLGTITLVCLGQG